MGKSEVMSFRVAKKRKGKGGVGLREYRISGKIKARSTHADAADQRNAF